MRLFKKNIIKIILVTFLFVNSIVCFAEQLKPSYKELNLKTLSMINIINDYQKGLSEKEIIKNNPSWAQKEAKLLYVFLRKGVRLKGVRLVRIGSVRE